MPLIRLKRRIPLDAITRRALRGMATLASGAMASKLITLASLPLITRLYAPEHLGALSVFAGFVMLLAPLVSLQYDRGLPVAGRDAAAINLLALTMALIVAFSILLAAVLAVGAAPLLRLLSMEMLVPFWWMLPLGTFVYSSYLTLQHWATRRRSYRQMALASVAQSAAGNAGKLTLVFVLPAPLAILVGHVVALGGGAVILYGQFRSEFRRLGRHATLPRMRAMAKRHRSFPTFRLPSHLTLLLASQLPVFFIAGFYGAATAGQFGLAAMALSMPINLIGRKMGRAFFGETAELGSGDPEALRRAVRDVTRLLGSVGLVLTAFLVLASPSLFPFVFGAQWAEAGRFAAVLAIYLTAQFVAVPVMNVLTVVGREDLYLKVNLQRLGLALAVFLGTYLLDLDAFTAVLAYSLVLAAHYGITFMRLLGALRNG